MPYLGGYELSAEDKETLKKIDSPPIQHAHVLRWYNQVTHECGNKAESPKPEVKSAPAAKSGDSGGHSKNVDPTILPKSDVQRDGKTGQMKEDPIYVAHRNKMFDDLMVAQQKR